MSQISLRQAKDEDYDFLYQLHRATMQRYVAQTWGWDEEWQCNYFRQHFNPKLCQILTLAGQDVGVVSAVEEAEEISLSNIRVLPKHQGKGIGTTVINWVLDEARRENKPVILQVLKVNPARRLYDQLTKKQ